MRRRSGAVEMRDREIIGALHDTLLNLSRRPGRGIIGLFMEDPKTLLESVATQEAVDSKGVWFVNSYSEYLIGTNPHRTSDHGTWHLRETMEIYNERGNQIIGYKIKYDYRPRRNGGREQGPNLGLQEYAYNTRGHNKRTLCIIYEKRPKRKSNRNGEGVDQVQSEPDHEEAPVLLQIAGAPNPNYAATGPPTELLGAWDPDNDASKLGWFGLGDMTTYDSGSLDFSGGGWKHNEQSLGIIINEKSPKKKPKRNGEGVLLFQSKPEEAPVLQMAAANPNYAATGPPTALLGAWDPDDDASKLGWFGLGDMTTYDSGSLDFSGGGWKLITDMIEEDFSEGGTVLQMADANPNYAARGPSTAAALQGSDSADDFSKNDFGSLDFSDEGWKDSRFD